MATKTKEVKKVEKNIGLDVLGISALSSGLTMLQTGGEIATGAILALVGIVVLAIKYLKREAL